MPERDIKYITETGEKFRLRGKSWYKGAMPLEKAVFASKTGYPLTKEALVKETITYEELFRFGDDPLENEGYLYYIEVNSKTICRSKIKKTEV